MTRVADAQTAAGAPLEDRGDFTDRRDLPSSRVRILGCRTAATLQLAMEFAILRSGNSAEVSIIHSSDVDTLAPLQRRRPARRTFLPSVQIDWKQDSQGCCRAASRRLAVSSGPAVAARRLGGALWLSLSRAWKTVAGRALGPVTSIKTRCAGSHLKLAISPRHIGSFYRNCATPICSVSYLENQTCIRRDVEWTENWSAT